MKVDLKDPELFGNEAGEDEDEQVLNSYFFEKSEFARFRSPAQRLAFVRSRKGVGKSSLLKQTQFHRVAADAGELLVYVKAAELIALQDVKSASAADLLNGWQQRMCSRVNLELITTLRLPCDADQLTLIQREELSQFRGRNLATALLERLSGKGVRVALEQTRIGTDATDAGIERRFASRDAVVWLFIDDVDATFLNFQQERLRVGAFFSACRALVANVKGLNIRASVRTDVWTLLSQYDEALDKCEQYMLDLKWSTEETGRILENKIHSYITRTHPDDPQVMGLRIGTDRKQIFGWIFKEPFPWGRRKLEAFRPIHVLSAGRPRWAAQLCKLAGRDAVDKATDRIAIGHVRAILREYGQARVADLYKEHRHQCPNIESILETFSGGPTRYTTVALLERITSHIIKQHGTPVIDGAPAPKGSLSVAQFLYRTGFIAARDDTEDRGLGFIQYEDRPNLLSSPSNLDDGLPWEIHPSYRVVLRIAPDM